MGQDTDVTLCIWKVTAIEVTFIVVFRSPFWKMLENSGLNQATTVSVHILFNSLFTNHPAIRRY
jgi:hypothetical protein